MEERSMDTSAMDMQQAVTTILQGLAHLAVVPREAEPLQSGHEALTCRAWHRRWRRCSVPCGSASRHRKWEE